MTFKTILMGAAALGAVAMSTVSEAATTITYAGSIDSGDDVTGVFGLAGQSLAGQGISVVYSIDSPLEDYLQNFGDTFAGILGGSDIGVSGIISAIVTINGVSQNISGSSQGSYTKSNNENFDAISSFSAENFRTDTFRRSNFVASDIISFNSTFDNTNLFENGSFSFDPESVEFANGQFSFFETTNGVVSLSAGGTFNISSVTVSSLTSAVPEPATWAMFLLGFGAIGYSMRRRKGTTASVSFA